MNKSMHENDDMKLEYNLSPQSMFYNGYGDYDMNKSLNIYSAHHSPFPNLIESKYSHFLPQPKFKTRRWQVGLSDKLNTKDKYRFNDDKKAEKI